MAKKKSAKNKEAAKTENLPAPNLPKKRDVAAGMGVFCSKKENHLVKFSEDFQKGNSVSIYKQSIRNSLVKYIKLFRMARVEAPFDRRVTWIEWHPTNPNLIAVASKSGDIYLWNLCRALHESPKHEGIGAGGSVQEMKFDEENPQRIYSVSVDGKFFLVDLITKNTRLFLSTEDVKKWYTTLDINRELKKMIVGDNNGSLTILTIDGQVSDRFQIHKNNYRVTHAEFSKGNPWFFCTSSSDRTVKFWDIRYMKKSYGGEYQPFKNISYDKPVNSVYFSKTDGCRLLTTDQWETIHVYSAPLWELQVEIKHPHRQFQHLTPIRAVWHPLDDIVVIGRYPHAQCTDYSPNEIRTIDFFDGTTGECLHRLSDRGVNGIMPVNTFNCTGDSLASGTGTRVVIWQPKPCEKAVRMDLLFPRTCERKVQSKHL